MIWLVASLVYTLVALVAWCRVTTTLAWRYLEGNKRSYPSSYGRHTAPAAGHWMLSGIAAILVAAIWPATGVAVVFSSRLFAPPASIRAERQAERIKQLERELELQ